MRHQDETDSRFRATARTATLHLRVRRSRKKASWMTPTKTKNPFRVSSKGSGLRNPTRRRVPKRSSSLVTACLTESLEDER